MKNVRIERKTYVTPVLKRHGRVDRVTQQGGLNVTDVPIGTPVDGDVTNVAAS